MIASFDCLDLLRRGKAATTHRRRWRRQTTRSDPELNATVTEQIETGCAASQNGWIAQWQIQHVAADMDVLRAGGDVGKQRPGIEKARLIRVILKRDEIETGLIGDDREIDGVHGRFRGRC